MNEFQPLIEVASAAPVLAVFAFIVLRFLKHLKEKDDAHNTQLGAAMNQISKSIDNNTDVMRELHNEILRMQRE